LDVILPIIILQVCFSTDFSKILQIIYSGGHECGIKPQHPCFFRFKTPSIYGRVSANSLATENQQIPDIQTMKDRQ
jgi:hypothetical protein